VIFQRIFRIFRGIVQFLFMDFTVLSRNPVWKALLWTYPDSTPRLSSLQQTPLRGLK
jgi:hypothetical protein